MLPSFIIDRIREYIDRNLIILERDENIEECLEYGIKISGEPISCEAMPCPEDEEPYAAGSAMLAKESALPKFAFKLRKESCTSGALQDIEEMIKNRDESFSQMLLRMIDEKGWKDSYCYKKANITRAHFNRIKNEPDYRIGKNSACALALALELRLPAAEAFLKRAGYSLSDASVFDLIIRYCFIHGIYNVNTVNEILFEFDQSLLGAK